MSSVSEPLAPASGAARLQSLYGRMVESLLGGGGLHELASIAAEAAGGRVVVALPGLGLASSAPTRGSGRADPPALRVPVATGDDAVGHVSLLAERPSPAAADAVHAAAMATLAYVALLRGDRSAADEPGAGPRVVEALLDGTPPDDVDAVFPHGALALCVGGTRGAAAAAIADAFPQARRAPRGDQVFALVPLPEPDDEANGRIVATARRLVRSVAAPAGMAAPEPEAVRLGGALREAEVVARLAESGAAPGLADGGTWWLLIRTALRAPEDLATLVREALGPLENATSGPSAELLPTFAAYVANGCNMNATSAAMPAHRHTVSHRLERLREITGLDPLVPEDREQLGVALKARVVLAAACAQR